MSLTLGAQAVVRRLLSGQRAALLSGVVGGDVVAHDVELVDGAFLGLVEVESGARVKNAWCSVNLPVSASVTSDLRPQSSFREVRQCVGVPNTSDQRLEHLPARDAEDVRGDRGQLDPGVLQQLPESLGLTGTLSGDRRAGPGSGPGAAGSASAARTSPGPDRVRHTLLLRWLYVAIGTGEVGSATTSRAVPS